MKLNLITDEDVKNLTEKAQAEKIILERLEQRQSSRTDLLLNEVINEVYTDLNIDKSAVEDSYNKSRKLYNQYNKSKLFIQPLTMLLLALITIDVFLNIINIITNGIFFLSDFIKYFSGFILLVLISIIYPTITYIKIRSNLTKICKINKSTSAKSQSNEILYTEINEEHLKVFQRKIEADKTLLERTKYINFDNNTDIISKIRDEVYKEFNITNDDIALISITEKKVETIYQSIANIFLAAAFMIFMVIYISLSVSVPMILTGYPLLFFVIYSIIFIIPLYKCEICIEKRMAQRYGDYFKRRLLKR